MIYNNEDKFYLAVVCLQRSEENKYYKPGVGNLFRTADYSLKLNFFCETAFEKSQKFQQYNSSYLFQTKNFDLVLLRLKHQTF